MHLTQSFLAVALSASAVTAQPLIPRAGSSLPKTGLSAWWGQAGGDLNTFCNDDSFDSIVLSFVNKFSGAGGFPGLNLAGALSGTSPAQKAAGATDLLDGTPIVPAIQACQKSGKKVFISLGGGDAQGSDAKLKDDQAGRDLADQIWNLFLGGTGKLDPLRPFGTGVVLDGVDLDIENRDQTGWSAFIDQMRGNFKFDTSKTFLISAAPQCPRNGGKGDASLADSTLKKTDITWVQFYNNPSCEHGSAGFTQAVQDWAAAVAPSQLWIAAPGGPDKASAGSGFAPIATVQKEVATLKSLKLPNLGGWALFDAQTATVNKDYQKDVAQAIA